MNYSVFDKIDIEDMITYLEMCGYGVVTTENKDILEKIKEICRELQPNGCIDKEDAKKLICDYLDFWMDRSF